MTQYELSKTTMYLEDLRAVEEGEGGTAMVFLHLYLRDMPGGILIHANRDDVPAFMAAWDAVHNPEDATDVA